MKKNNKIMLPSYFNNFGVMSSLESFIKAKVNAEKRIKNKKTADLTTKEQEAISFVLKPLKELALLLQNFLIMNMMKMNHYII